MGGAVPLRPDPSLPEPALAFIKEGQQRWLKTTAIVKFLSDLAPLLRATGHCNAAAPELPTAGDMYLINKKSCRYYRRDGRNWMKNPDGKTVRERHVKLRVDGMEVCACYYAYEMHPLKPSDPPLARRCYWLLSPDELKGQADLVLVHYLVDSEEAAAAAGEAAEVSPMHKAALARFEVAARARAEARQTDAAEAAAAAAAPAAPAAPEPAAARPQALKAPVARSPFQVPAAPSPFQPQPASRPSLATAAAPSPFQAPPASRLLQAPTAAAAGPSPFQPPGPSPFLPQAPSPFQPPAPSPFLPQAPSPFRPSAPSPFQAGSVSVPMESDCSLEPYSSSEGELLQQGPFCLGEGSYGQPRSYSQGEAMAIDQAFSQGGGFMGGEGSGFGSSGGFGEQEAPPHFRRQGALGNPMEQDLHRAVAAQQVWEAAAAGGGPGLHHMYPMQPTHCVQPLGQWQAALSAGGSSLGSTLAQPLRPQHSQQELSWGWREFFERQAQKRAAAEELSGGWSSVFERQQGAHSLGGQSSSWRAFSSLGQESSSLGLSLPGAGSAVRSLWLGHESCSC